MLKEFAPPLKGLAELVKRLTQRSDPEEVGYLACARAFESAAAATLSKVGAPTQVKRLTAEMRDGLDRLVPVSEIEFSTFSFDRADSHEFVQNALEILDNLAQAIGYSEPQRRDLGRRTTVLFSSRLKTVLAHRATKDKFLPFTDRIGLGSDELTATSLLDSHAAYLRAQFHDRKLFDHEPLALSDIYVEPQCSELRWAQLSSERIDPFDTRDLARHELLERVMALIGDPRYRDAIVIQGVAGAGKSSLTLRLCMELLAEGLVPVRIRLRDLQLDRHVKEALPAAVRYFSADHPEGHVMPEHAPALFRGGHAFGQSVRFGEASIAPIVLILDGWDELSVTATSSFRDKIDRFLEQVRAEYLGEGRKSLIRVILTGRPSLAFTDTKFLLAGTRVCTLLPLLPDRVSGLLHEAERVNAFETEGVGIL